MHSSFQSWNEAARRDCFPFVFLFFGLRFHAISRSVVCRCSGRIPVYSRCSSRSSSRNSASFREICPSCAWLLPFRKYLFLRLFSTDLDPVLTSLYPKRLSPVAPTVDWISDWLVSIWTYPTLSTYWSEIFFPSASLSSTNPIYPYSLIDEPSTLYLTLSLPLLLQSFLYK